MPEDKGAARGSPTGSARCTLPANGVYYLYLGDGQGKGAGDCALPLAHHRPQPDFEIARLVALQASTGAPAPTRARVTVVTRLCAATVLPGYRTSINRMRPRDTYLAGGVRFRAGADKSPA